MKIEADVDRDEKEKGYSKDSKRKLMEQIVFRELAEHLGGFGMMPEK